MPDLLITEIDVHPGAYFINRIIILDTLLWKLSYDMIWFDHTPSRGHCRDVVPAHETVRAQPRPEICMNDSCKVQGEERALTRMCAAHKPPDPVALIISIIQRNFIRV